MSAAIKPQHLNQSHSYRFESPFPDSASDGMDTAIDGGASTSALPWRRTRLSTSPPRSRSLPRIDTEQLKSLSIREKNTARHPTPSSSTAGQLREQQFQKYREFLWQMGRANLGNKDASHVNIAPVRLPTTPAPSYDSITIYTVVHSQGHCPVGLRRKFDRHMLSATVPEPFQSPSTPNFDREELLSAIVDTNKTLGSSRARRSTKTVAASRDTRMGQECIPNGIPMHFPYARSSLPILAAIIMSNQVRVGDTLELPLPHPEAWAETVAWVYTGEEALMTDKVRENVQYLGGRVW